MRALVLALAAAAGLAVAPPRGPYGDISGLKIIKPRDRQDAPSVFDMTTVAYAARAGYVVSAEGLFDGKVRAVVVPRERALDIDTELDLEIAEFLAHRSGGSR